jgi:hypothetical protein
MLNLIGKTLGIGAVLLSLLFSGCAASYKKCVRPTPTLARLSPELANLTDEKIELYLRSNVRPAFPTVLAIAKLTSRYSDSFVLTPIRGQEAGGWQKLAGPGRSISQVHFLNPLLMENSLTLKKLRDGAALTHAPLLLVYLQTDNSSQGYNSSAIAYWSIVGLFVVPGNTVGHYSVCQAILVDTRTGVVLATDQTDSICEENVLAGAVDIASERVEKQSLSNSVAELQSNFRVTIREMDRSGHFMPNPRRNKKGKGPYPFHRQPEKLYSTPPLQSIK